MQGRCESTGPRCVNQRLKQLLYFTF